MKREYLFTSESVSKGHPDKVADQISDAILDAYLTGDENSKVACEVLVTSNLVVVSGEINSKAIIDVDYIVRKVIKDIGYDYDGNEFKYDTCEILNKLHQQSPDINMGVDLEDGKIGAGDQGIMFGYAINETDSYMPLSIQISHDLLLELDNFRENNDMVFADYIRPDSKSQVTIKYDINGNPTIDTILISTQHTQELVDSYEEPMEILKIFINDWVIKEVEKKYDYKLFKDYKLLVNPTGNFVVGGPAGDTGLTGRKIVVDQYGGRCPVGGGAFSGKDGNSKVDRSAAYASRWIAKNIVASGLAEECLIQLSYAIGMVNPISIYVETYGTGKVDDIEIENFIKENYELTPKWISDKLNLTSPIYQKTAAYGHFGRDIFSWEKLNLVENIKKYFNI
jgi:S-adenosylmethionine synthetase